MMKKVLSVLLTVSLLIGVLATSAFAASDKGNGKANPRHHATVHVKDKHHKQKNTKVYFYPASMRR